MNWFEKVLQGIKDFFEWLGSEETQQQAATLLRTVLLIAKLLDRFNAPISNREKPAALRIVMDLLRVMKDEEKETLIEYLQATDFSKLDSHEVDKLIGDGIAVYVAQKNPLTNVEPGDFPEY